MTVKLLSPVYLSVVNCNDGQNIDAVIDNHWFLFILILGCHCVRIHLAHRRIEWISKVINVTKLLQERIFITFNWFLLTHQASVNKQCDISCTRSSPLSPLWCIEFLKMYAIWHCIFFLLFTLFSPIVCFYLFELLSPIASEWVSVRASLLPRTDKKKTDLNKSAAKKNKYTHAIFYYSEQSTVYGTICVYQGKIVQEMGGGRGKEEKENSLTWI